MKDDTPFWESAKTFSFVSRKMPVDISLRPLFRISLLCLSLFLCCRKQQGSFLRLQFLNWLIKNRKDDGEELDASNLKVVLKNNFLHLDPFFNIALQFAVGDKLVVVETTKKIRLTEKGQALCKFILKNQLFADETTYLLSLKKIPDTAILRKIQED